MFEKVKVKDLIVMIASIYPTAAIHEPELCTLDEDGDGFGATTDGLAEDTIVTYEGGSDCDDTNMEIFPICTI